MLSQRTVILVGIGVFLALFTGWTVRRLWRRAQDPYSRMVYGFGVKAFGVLWGAFMVLDEARKDWRGLPHLLLSLLTTLPIALWAGYFWGRAMAWFYGLEKPE